MRKRITVFALVFIVLLTFTSLVGCGSVDKAFVEGCDEFGNKSGMFDRHDRLATEAKERGDIDADTLEIWLRTTKLFREHIEVGKTATEE